MDWVQAMPGSWSLWLSLSHLVIGQSWVSIQCWTLECWSSHCCLQQTVPRHCWSWSGLTWLERRQFCWSWWLTALLSWSGAGAAGGSAGSEQTGPQLEQLWLEQVLEQVWELESWQQRWHQLQWLQRRVQTMGHCTSQRDHSQLPPALSYPHCSHQVLSTNQRLV